MRNIRILYLAMLALFVVSAAADADTYQWLDEKGVVNFTDDPDNIPKKYRKKAKVTRSTEREKSVQPRPSEDTPRQAGAEAAPSTSPAKVLYGGHDQAWWKARYSALRGEIKSIQDNLPGKKQELDELRRKLRIYTYTRNRIAYQDKLAEIQKDEDRIKTLTEQLASLDAEAGVAGVPFDWRQ